MGIKTEYNPDLALRNIAEWKAGRRKAEECIPERLDIGREYAFLKEGQRIYWLDGEIPLVETAGGGKLSRPKTSVRVLEVTHSLQDGKVWTRGRYTVIAVFDPTDSRAHVDGWTRIG